jgi:Tol biopolymer transport system component
MTITPGTRLGPYEIVAPLGAGGMGEVWSARDARLDRSVAIKVLPAGLSHDLTFRSRFDREAKTISQLSHPHICTLHDIGEQDGTLYLVMELVEGESLASRLDRGALPMREVLLYGAQIAEALDRAHRAGIVHRDLKPGNVMITRSGVKLLDFGLAKSAARSAPVSDGTTIVNEKPLTAEGTIVGTIQYMSPEQLTGEAIDARSDIFAFGAVLYEMAAGRRAFDGANKTSLIASILTTEPRPITQLQPVSPPAFERVVSKCLFKDPEKRWQSAFDIADELRWIAQDASGSGAAAVRVPARRRFASLVPWAVALAAVVVAAFLFWRGRDRPIGRVTKTIVSTQIDSAWNMAPALSPDGRHLAYPAQGALWIRSLDELEPRKIVITGEHQPVLFWSPDSKWLSFVSDAKLWKIAAGGNTPVLIATLSDLGPTSFHSGAWGAEDRIVLASRFGGLFEMSARGGSPVEFLPAGPELVDFHNLSFLPDGKTLLAVPHKLDNMVGVEVIRGKERQTVASFDAMVRDVVYSPTGHLLASLRGPNSGVWIVPFSLRNMAATGKPSLVYAGGGACSVSADGSLVFVSHIDEAPGQIVRLDRGGKLLANVSEVVDTPDYLVLSPDETSFAASVRQDNNYLSMEEISVATGKRRRLTRGFYRDRPVAWSHDGRHLLAAREPNFNFRDPRFGLWLVPLDGGGEPRNIAPGWSGAFTPDDQSLVFAKYANGHTSDIATLPLSGAAKATPFKPSFPDATLALSPDGRFLAYGLAPSGSEELFVIRYPGGGAVTQLSRGAGTNPVWSRDGKTIYFVSGSRLMAAPFTDSPPAVGQPVMLFDTASTDIDLTRRFQVFRDGTILAVRELPRDARQVVLVQNWFSDIDEPR